ncbi:MAG: hypothetical protein DRI95_10245 [Bacteroidetes bacterium]|nr:MAG: hypothetical protein DRI95_10245 [Bacteroidota bacterium]
MNEERMKNNAKIKMNCRYILNLVGVVVITLIGFLSFGQADSAVMNQGKRPNIIFILGDNHNADFMGCAGHSFIKTPGMDRLAREGLMFTNTFNTTSLCSPSRASILTGTYAHNHGVKNNHISWTGTRKTFLEYLSEAGYSTAFIGKWHMPGGLPEMPFLDLYVSYTDHEGQGRYFNCPMIVNGEEVASRKSYITEEVTDYAIEFMENSVKTPAKDRKPFCIYLAHRPGHPPFQSPKDIRGMYDSQNISKNLPKQVDEYWFGKTDGNVFQGVMMGSYYDQYRKYCETITAMDRDIVRILDKVDELGLEDNTLVIYMGDNGMQWGTHGCHGIREPYEESIRLPFIVRAPWLIRDNSEKCDQIIANVDIAPFLLDIAGVEVPKSMDGKSLKPLLREPDGKFSDACLLEFWRYYPENTPSYTGVRTQRYKYVEFEKSRKPWLFDLKKDPKEEENIYNTPNGQKEVKRLQAIMKELKSQ